MIGMSTCVAGYISFHALVASLCFSWLGYTLGQTITALSVQPAAVCQPQSATHPPAGQGIQMFGMFTSPSRHCCVAMEESAMW